jgi:hypothetical protein
MQLADLSGKPVEIDWRPVRPDAQPQRIVFNRGKMLGRKMNYDVAFSVVQERESGGVRNADSRSGQPGAERDRTPSLKAGLVAARRAVQLGVGIPSATEQTISGNRLLVGEHAQN